MKFAQIFGKIHLSIAGQVDFFIHIVQISFNCLPAPAGVVFPVHGVSLSVFLGLIFTVFRRIFALIFSSCPLPSCAPPITVRPEKYFCTLPYACDKMEQSHLPPARFHRFWPAEYPEKEADCICTTAHCHRLFWRPFVPIFSMQNEVPAPLKSICAVYVPLPAG